MYSIKELQSLISFEIDQEIRQLNSLEPKNLYEPVGYALSMGGKRLRPVMVLLAYNLFNDSLTKVIPAAIAIEVFHNFTLLHDDMMDQAEMRRNSLSVYKKYNENIAILSGDAMSIMAYNYLLKCDTSNPVPLIRLFSETALEVCEGQQYDMDFEGRMDVSIPEYVNMIRLKTAVLLAGSLKMGALAAQAPEKIANQLYDFGLNLGIAFQLQDDLLDVFAVQEKFGKKIGGDIASNKKTFLLLKALELASPPNKSIIRDWIVKKEFEPEQKVKAITDIYNELEIKKITEDQINRYYQEAISIWEKIEVESERKAELLELAKMIMGRDH
jgi:geranylgeranyl diphosphate synthase type II